VDDTALRERAKDGNRASEGHWSRTLRGRIPCLPIERHPHGASPERYLMVGDMVGYETGGRPVLLD
jgi:hypothetical protein